MDKIIEDLKRINDTLEAYFLENETNDNEGFNKLANSEFADPKLKEALILLHSKYTAELEALRKYNFRYINKIINSNIDAYKNTYDKYNELNRLINDINTKKKGFNIPKAYITATALIFTLGSLFYMFTLDKEAGSMLIDLLKSVIQSKADSEILNSIKE